MGSKRDSVFDYFLFFIISALFILLLTDSLNRSFDHDEFEHLHSSWLILQGKIPYLDFFQHHHGLLWILILPFIKIFGETAATIFAVRVFIFLIVAATAYLTFLSTRLITGSNTCGLLSILWLFMTDIFQTKAIEIRPEIPQTFFIVLSFYYLVKYLQCKYPAKYLNTSFLCVSIAFIFIQKTVYYIAAYSAVIFILFFLKKLNIRKFIQAVPFALAPVVLVLAYLVVTGSLKDYWLTNWILNLKWMDSPSPGPDEKFLIYHVVTLSSCFFISMGYIFAAKKKPMLAMAGFLGILQLLAAVAAGKYLKQYFYPAVFFFSIVGADLFAHLIRKTGFKFKRMIEVLLVIILLIPPLLPLDGTIKLLYSQDGDNMEQINRIDYVLNNTKEADLVYDGDIQFNIFREDLHYFWFSVKPGAGLESWQRNVDNRFDNYDIYRLIVDKKPKIISNYFVDIKKNGLNSLYKQARYGLFIKK